MTKEAMKMALEALTYIYTETTADEDELIDQAITAIKEALAQPEQEPIGYISEAETDRLIAQKQETIEGLNRDYDLLFAEHQLLLKKEWVGLTQTQVKLLWEGVQEEAVKSGDSLNWVFYTHINEALKEKNT